MINTALLKQICEVPGAPGYEQKIRKLVIELAKPLADEVRVDAMGNVTAIKKGSSDKKVLVAAHMDEISFIVTHIDEDGFIRFHPMGGFDPKTLTSQRVIVHGKEDLPGVMGTKPVHLMRPEERGKGIDIGDFFIDCGLPKKTLEPLVGVGTPVTRERSLIEMGDCVNSKSLDNRVSVFILLEVLRQLKGKSIPFDLYAGFTVQEEVGLRGAINLAHQVNPDFAFGLDVTIAFDTPGAQAHEAVTRLGKGTAIKVMDGSVISDYRMVTYMKEVAVRENIPYQMEILPAGGTDTAGLQRQGKNGAIAGAVSIPLRYIHQTIEMANKGDIAASIQLLEQCIVQLDRFDWSH